MKFRDSKQKIKTENKVPKYNKESVSKAINKDRRIGSKEASLIHGLLKGWRK